MLKKVLFGFLGLISLGLITCLILFSLDAHLVDIRPDEIKKDGITQARSQKGRVIMLEAARVAGQASWDSMQSYQVWMRDNFFGMMGEMAKPWPENNTPVVASYVTNAFDGQIMLLDGSLKNQLVGMENWKTYTQASSEATRNYADNKDLLFWLPTYQYFLEAPFRLLEAPIIAFAGERELKGQQYDLVYLTWEAPEPNATYDQYVAWINQESKHMDYLNFTIREVGAGMFSNFMVNEDYREIEGVWIPFKQTVQSDLLNDETILHQIILEKFSFNSIDRKLITQGNSENSRPDNK